jgi:hypothetical protein
MSDVKDYVLQALKETPKEDLVTLITAIKEPAIRSPRFNGKLSLLVMRYSLSNQLNNYPVFSNL